MVAEQFSSADVKGCLRLLFSVKYGRVRKNSQIRASELHTASNTQTAQCQRSASFKTD